MNFNRVFKHGTTVFLTTNDGWKSEYFKAYIQPIRYKNKVYLEGNYTEIGRNDNDVFVYLGPASHDISEFCDDLRICDLQNRYFMVDRVEKIVLDGKILYIWAVIRKVREVRK